MGRPGGDGRTRGVLRLQGRLRRPGLHRLHLHLRRHRAARPGHRGRPHQGRGRPAVRRPVRPVRSGGTSTGERNGQGRVGLLPGRPASRPVPPRRPRQPADAVRGTRPARHRGAAAQCPRPHRRPRRPARARELPGRTTRSSARAWTSSRRVGGCPSRRCTGATGARRSRPVSLPRTRRRGCRTSPRRAGAWTGSSTTAARTTSAVRYGSLRSSARCSSSTGCRERFCFPRRNKRLSPMCWARGCGGRASEPAFRRRASGPPWTPCGTRRPSSPRPTVIRPRPASTVTSSTGCCPTAIWRRSPARVRPALPVGHPPALGAARVHQPVETGSSRSRRPTRDPGFEHPGADEAHLDAHERLTERLWDDRPRNCGRPPRRCWTSATNATRSCTNSSTSWTAQGTTRPLSAKHCVCYVTNPRPSELPVCARRPLRQSSGPGHGLAGSRGPG